MKSIVNSLHANSKTIDNKLVNNPDHKSRANIILKKSAQLWFFVAVIGQWAFAFYIVIFYGGSAAQGDFQAWNKILQYGIIAGDNMGNLTVAVHILLAAIITFGGPLQLIPQIRAHYPVFHHWNGRIYILTVFIISIAALYLVITRGLAGGNIMALGMSLNAVLIMIFAALTVRFAILRDITTHRRWALRLFLVVSGVWFFRVGLMLWLLLNGGPVGFDMETFKGPFLDFLSFAQYLFPLLILEIYLCTKDHANSRGQTTMAAGLFVLTLGMGAGMFVAFMGMWLPNI